MKYRKESKIEKQLDQDQNQNQNQNQNNSMKGGSLFGI